MSAPEIVMFAVVLLVGFPAAWRNLTAFALVAAYLLAQGLWALGVTLDAGMMFMVDLTVVAVIYAKAAVLCPEIKFQSVWHQLSCFGANLTPCDRLIMAVFVFAVWPAYVLSLSDFTRWWLLWFAATGQFLLAGLESFENWRRAKAARVAEPDHPSSGSLRAAWAGTGRWLT